MRRGIYILPNLFTTGNLMAGFWSIISVLQDQYHFAALAILAAAVFDFFDGKVAKLSGATSKFGMQYDSLADIVSFGIAPALLAFGWALRPYGEWGWLAAFTFVACGGIRLARFNVREPWLPPVIRTCNRSPRGLGGMAKNSSRTGSPVSSVRPRGK